MTEHQKMPDVGGKMWCYSAGPESWHLVEYESLTRNVANTETKNAPKSGAKKNWGRDNGETITFALAGEQSLSVAAKHTALYNPSHSINHDDVTLWMIFTRRRLRL